MTQLANSLQSDSSDRRHGVQSTFHTILRTKFDEESKTWQRKSTGIYGWYQQLGQVSSPKYLVPTTAHGHHQSQPAGAECMTSDKRLDSVKADYLDRGWIQ
ncbi:hypothetical protein ACJBU6_03358 [Exserohilum turcicum]